MRYRSDIEYNLRLVEENMDTINIVFDPVIMSDKCSDLHNLTVPSTASSSTPWIHYSYGRFTALGWPNHLVPHF